MYAMKVFGTKCHGDNSTRTSYSICQFTAWYLLAGIERAVDSIDMEPQCETILDEIDRLEQWDKKHGGWYDPDKYAALAKRVRSIRAELSREYFYVVDNTNDARA